MTAMRSFFKFLFTFVYEFDLKTLSSAVKSPPVFPVFIVPAGSTSMISHYPSADGLCSAPLGTTNNSPFYFSIHLPGNEKQIYKEPN